MNWTQQAYIKASNADPSDHFGNNVALSADGIEVLGANPTDPKSIDTDADGVADGVEDADRDGRVDAGETDPLAPDTDGVV